MVNLLPWVIALPAFGAALLLIGRPLAPRAFDRFGHWLAVALAFGSFAVSVALFVGLLGRDAGDRRVVSHLWTWIETAHLNVGTDLAYDQLSSLFLLLITGVGALIHLYSVGYMAHDERRTRFFAYLNLFVAAMLILVLAENYVLLFLGWEGVGVASYLLIGFWQHKPSAAAAAKKAFVMNRVGDMGLSLAIALAFVTFGTTSIGAIAEHVDDAGTGTLNALGLLLLLGACGKSAQVPLQAWLLDAMEGPTPVSALIHAATMVTAGVYLIVRSGFVFEQAHAAQTVVAVVAVVTLLWGAVIGTAKDDIKKVLAGSTMSQIGYMMLGASLGPVGYVAAIFHLLTHGAFKANMFLGAGSVMHAMDDDVDMRHYGALRTALPVTFGTFACGYLAIIGFPGLSGFWSKDKLIEAALDHDLVLGVLAILGAGITAFYMTRLMLMTWYGAKRWREHVHPHESPRVMTVPLIVLAFLSVFAGALAIGGWIGDWLAPVVGEAEHGDAVLPGWAVSAIVVAVVAAGVYVAWRLVGVQPVPGTAPEDVSWPVRAARADLYGDAINSALVVEPGRRLTATLLAADRHVVDGALSGGPIALGAYASVLRRLQNGYVRSYALAIVVGAIALPLIIWGVRS